MRVAAFGRTHWLYESVRAVVAQGHEVVLIGTSSATPEYTTTEHDFEELSNELGCAYFCDSSINSPEYAQMAHESGASVAISVNWLNLFHPEMLSQFTHGVINAHAGDLPRFRGNACPNWAMIVGESEVALTLHQMTSDLDAGPILMQRKFPLTSSTYIADVYRFMTENIPTMFVEVLNGLDKGTITAQAQPVDPSLSLRCFPRIPSDGRIDWRRPATELARLVRASGEPFAGAYSFIGSDRIIIWRARAATLPYPYLGTPGQVVGRRPRVGEVDVLTGRGILVIEEAEKTSGTRCQGSELITSSRSRLGMYVCDEIELLRSEVEELKRQVANLQTTK